MSKCRCEESKAPNPRWRKKSQRPRGKGYEIQLICLSCEWEWWSKSEKATTFPTISQEERQKLETPFGNSTDDNNTAE